MTYFLQLNIALAVFYGLYCLLFSSDTFFGLRRAYLLTTLLLAALLPLCAQHLGLFQTLPRPFLNGEMTGNVISLISPTAEESPGTGERCFLIATAVYAAVAALLLLRRLWQAGCIVGMALRLPRAEVEGTRVCLTNGTDGPFSFFGWIFINPVLHTQGELHEILLHEQTHARQLHSMDVVLSELTCALCWPNPCAWLLRHEIRINLEFLADERVLAGGFDRKTYELHLLGLSYQRPVATISNYFNVLPLKKRITMMNRKKSNRALRAKYLLAVPAVALMLMSFSMWTDGSGVSPSTLSKTALLRTGGGQMLQPSDSVYDVPEVMPEFPGGTAACMEYLQNNLRYPKEAMENGAEGYVVVQFVIEADGSISRVKVVRSVNELLDAEAVRVVRNMPDWKPGRIKGEAVAVRYNVPILFRLQKEQEKDKDK